MRGWIVRQVSRSSEKVDRASLNEIVEVLEHEREQAKEYKAIVGKAPKALDQDLEDELKRYREAHKVASDSNTTLHKAMQVHIRNLKVLTKPLDELQKDISSMADLDEDSEASIAEFQRIVKKVDEMKKQRFTLLDQIRDDILNDDITKKLVLHKDKQMSEIFALEMTKHDQKKKFLLQNLTAQENILKALTEVNAKYVILKVDVFRVEYLRRGLQFLSQ
jgi:tyrosine-protein phosphatase non-receptor type 23